MQTILQYLMPILLILFILYRRIRRSIGFQFFQSRKLIFRIAILSIVSLFLLGASATHPNSYWYDIAGIILGLILTRYAIRHSLFEVRQGKLFYRTHIWIEFLTLVLFLSRFAYRLTYLFTATAANSSSDPSMYSQQFTRDPSTRAVFFILAAYFISYYSFLLKKGKTFTVEKNADLIFEK